MGMRMTVTDPRNKVTADNGCRGCGSKTYHVLLLAQVVLYPRAARGAKS